MGGSRWKCVVLADDHMKRQRSYGERHNELSVNPGSSTKSFDLVLVDNVEFFRFNGFCLNPVRTDEPTIQGEDQLSPVLGEGGVSSALFHDVGGPSALLDRLVFYPAPLQVVSTRMCTGNEGVGRVDGWEESLGEIALRHLQNEILDASLDRGKTSQQARGQSRRLRKCCDGVSCLYGRETE